MKGVLISAPASGSGKTTFTLGLLAALRARGVAVQPFKSGPDYIDPGFHRAASGRDSFNLDGWAMDQAVIAGLLARASDADLAVVEGSMGLLDGVAHCGAMGNGASADLAALTGWPVIMVIDASGQAQSAALVAAGLRVLRPDLRLAGVVLNRVASPRHHALIAEGMAAAGVRILGALPRRGDMSLPERHLGLVQAEESELGPWLEQAARLVEDHCDIEAILTAIKDASGAAKMGPAPLVPDPLTPAPLTPVRLPPPGQRIALARDRAFSFAYPHLLASWRAAGAEVLPFSPLADEPPPPADVCWLPGGYPELYAGQIAAAGQFLEGLRRFDGPVHGECGGYMVLGRALIDKDGTAHQMAGMLGLVTSYAKRKMHLGYRLARLNHPIPGFATQSRLRGHEFHYSTVIEQPDPPLAHVEDAAGQAVAETGSCRGRVTGSYFHLIAPA